MKNYLIRLCLAALFLPILLLTAIALILAMIMNVLYYPIVFVIKGDFPDRSLDVELCVVLDDWLLKLMDWLEEKHAI